MSLIEENIPKSALNRFLPLGYIKINLPVLFRRDHIHSPTLIGPDVLKQAIDIQTKPPPDFGLLSHFFFKKDDTSPQSGRYKRNAGELYKSIVRQAKENTLERTKHHAFKFRHRRRRTEAQIDVLQCRFIQ